MPNAEQEMEGIKSKGAVSQQSNNPDTKQKMKQVEAEKDVFQKIWAQTPIDLNQLTQDLAQLRSVLAAEATDPEHYNDISKVRSAELEAEKQDGPQALAVLSKVGNWVLDVATRIGATVAAKAIEQSLGLGKP